MIKYSQLKHAGRFQQIIRALIRNGFGFFVQKIGLFNEIPGLQRMRVKEKQPHKSTEERIRILLEELGPSFVKLGQIASTRNDIFPPALIQELEKLQDHVTEFPLDEAQKVFETEMGEPLSTYFASFREQPLASASIGQVYRAETHDGNAVAVKIQRPGIQRKIEIDLDILHELAGLAERHIHGLQRYHLPTLVKEFSKMIRRELDYTIEGRNTEKIYQQTAEDPNVYIPAIDWRSTTQRVLTMELIAGKNINQLDLSSISSERRRHISEIIANTLCRQIFIDGFYHADPHPGNIFIMKDDAVAFLDFGMVGRLNSDLRASLAKLVMGILRKNTDEIMYAVGKIGNMPPGINRPALKKEIEEFQDLYFSTALQEIQFGKVINDLLSLIGDFDIEIPHDITLVAKSLVTAESLISTLDPDISIIEVVEPLGPEILRQHYSVKRMKRNLHSYALEYMDIIGDLPDTIKKMTATMEKGKLHHDVEIPEMQLLGIRVSQAANQLSLSILLLAVSFILGALILGITLGAPDPSGLLQLPVLEIGFILFFLLFAWAMISILWKRKKQ
ncbi:ABC1 kinase family protein [Alkalicoccus daliensis]|uniref:Ubiquinone biosynthesis protein n=1 Tax=Alkalicoccus daliensis TaxID=745820 RepID=A0A1H0HJF1_9BACI|nr:AarF/ABC1/UbiB kinase family protein [Alkalicoccus daliensis]SDO19174.1 ubiquinone biosynthesis protein [Alkalicoccus daliensis]